ncbi:arginase family protein [Pseudomonas sp. MM211]|uniref:arginase family protein n=1 Tax=Pseudomonas sp. MM211 TaxID=2866808 RepID=UPI001CEC5A3B|nr:arginase family protein [Pseudomonas sp. MM211]UCJ16222.1 arginase family protein [Pseudomonas sp. MM211]
MSESTGKTLRLLFPQWQGGNNPPYHFGSQLLAWLAPKADGPVEEVPVAAPDDAPLALENGIVGRSALLAQAAAARALIDKHRPDRLVVLGGDCLVDLAPFAYLNERYDGELAVLWIDAHPDLMTPAQFQHAHAMVLGNLLGNGDADFVNAVPRPLKAQNVLYLGLHDPSEWEAAEIQRLGLGNVSPSLLAERGSQPVIEWFKATGARHLAIHFDLDALDPAFFRGLLFANPTTPEGAFDGVAQGQLSMGQVVEVLSDLSASADVVGIGIAEHLPWDALALKTMLTRLPLIGNCR